MGLRQILWLHSSASSRETQYHCWVLFTAPFWHKFSVPFCHYGRLHLSFTLTHSYSCWDKMEQPHFDKSIGFSDKMGPWSHNSDKMGPWKSSLKPTSWNFKAADKYVQDSLKFPLYFSFREGHNHCNVPQWHYQEKSGSIFTWSSKFCFFWPWKCSFQGDFTNLWTPSWSTSIDGSEEVDSAFSIHFQYLQNEISPDSSRRGSEKFMFQFGLCLSG